MPLEVFGVLLKLNQHFSMTPNVLNVIFNNISADMLPLNRHILHAARFLRTAALLRGRGLVNSFFLRWSREQGLLLTRDSNQNKLNISFSTPSILINYLILISILENKLQCQ